MMRHHRRLWLVLVCLPIIFAMLALVLYVLGMASQFYRP